MLLSNRWMLSPAWIAPLWMSLSSAYIFSLVLALFALPVASYSACSACANLCVWCSALVLAGALCCLLVWCSALLVLVLLAAQISSLVIHFLPQQPPNPPHNCKLLKHCLYFPAFSYSCLALCSEDWTFLRPRFFLQISSSQWVVVVIYNQMQTHHCCGFLELFTAAKNCHEGPRAKRKPLRCAATSFVIPSAGLSPKWMRVMNGHHLHSRLYARCSWSSPVLTPCAS